MSKKNITKQYFKEDTPDHEIDTSDIPPLGEEFWENARIRQPKTKQSISIRLDADILDLSSNQGKEDYQS